MDEPRTAKSFRAAADRILRQETAVAAGVTRLLGGRVLADRVVTTDDDEWAVRLEALCALGQFDAVAISASAPLRLTRTRNVGTPDASDGSIATAIADARVTGSVVQAATRVRLEDGRLSDSVLVAPLAGIRGVTGHLLAFRVGRAFGVTDGHAAVSAAELASLEVQRTAAARRDADAARQAFALFEISRLSLLGEDRFEALQGAADVIADAMAHDVAQLWLLRPGGSLRLRAAHPREGLALEIARPGDHPALARALDGEVVRAHDPSLRAWLSRTTRDLIVAPIDGRAGPAGVLVVGRWRETYSADDEVIAATCARFIGRALLANDGWTAGAAARRDHAEDADTAASREAEAQLTGT